MSTEIIAGLLDDMEEEFTHFGYVALYQLGWALNNGTRSDEQRRELAQQAYDTFTARHRTRLVWSRWPIDLDSAWPVEPGTPLDFDLDPDGPPDTPLQVLVPASPSA